MMKHNTLTNLMWISKISIGLGCTVFLIGNLMRILQTKHWVEISIAGSIIFCFGFIYWIFQKSKLPFSDNNSFPDIRESLGITLCIMMFYSSFYPLKKILDTLHNKEMEVAIYYLIGYGIPLVLLYLARQSITGIKGFQVKTGKLLTIVLVIICTHFLYNGFINPLAYLIPKGEATLRRINEVAITQMTEFSSVIGAVILAPVLEELIFRGIILDGLLRKYNAPYSVCFSAFLFAILHLNSWQFAGAVSTLIGGIFLGWIYFKTRNILYPIVSHMTVNFTWYLMLTIQHNKISKEVVTTVPVAETDKLITAMIFSGIIITLLIYFLNRQFNKTSQPLFQNLG